MREERARLLYEVARRHRRGDSIRSISRALGIARRTVGRMLAELEARRQQGDDALAREQPTRRAPRPSKLDAFTEVIDELLTAHPDLLATRLHEELTARGFDGGYTIVRQHLNKIRPKAAKRPRMMVITAPGKQGQFDWSPYKLADGSPIYLWSCILSSSRFRYMRFCSDMRQPTIFRQLRLSFEHHGGIASEYVTDSMAGVVDRWEGDEPILNLRAVDFAAFYEFEFHIAPRGDGAYKGKVERNFRHIEDSFFNGRTFHTMAEANAALDTWLQRTANGKKNTTTRRKPVDALVDEVPHLRPLPTHRWDDRELAHRIVDAYCYVRFDGNRYLAPKRCVGRWVYVRACDEFVQIIADAATVVARHPRAPRNDGALVPPPNSDSSRPRRRPTAELVAALAQWSDVARAWAEQVTKHKRYAASELGKVLELRANWALKDLMSAVEYAARYHAYDAASVERILQARAKPRTLEDHLAAASRAHIREAMAQAPVNQRGLQDYARLLAGSPSTKDVRSETDDEEPPT